MGLSGCDFLTLASSVTMSSALEVELVLLSLILSSFPLLMFPPLLVCDHTALSTLEDKEMTASYHSPVVDLWHLKYSILQSVWKK